MASKAGQPSTKLAKADPAQKPGADAAGISAGSKAGSAGISAVEPSPAGAGAESENSSGIKATMFIGVHGNAGPKGSLIALPAGKDNEDSDIEACGGGAGDMTHAVVSKRNRATMSKHSLKIMKSIGPEGAGNGLFTESDMPAGTLLPVKGIWFNDLEQLNTWLGQQHHLTAQAMSRKIVEVHFAAPPEGAKVSHYFIMTSLVGYVNAYTNIIQRPNAQLVLNSDRPLGQHSLQVRLLTDLAPDRVIIIAYGARHLVKDHKKSGPKLKRQKKGATSAAGFS